MHLVEGINILHEECGIDRKELLKPLAKVKQFEKETKGISKYMTEEEKIQYYSLL